MEHSYLGNPLEGAQSSEPLQIKGSFPSQQMKHSCWVTHLPIIAQSDTIGSWCKDVRLEEGLSKKVESSLSLEDLGERCRVAVPSQDTELEEEELCLATEFRITRFWGSVADESCTEFPKVILCRFGESIPISKEGE